MLSISVTSNSKFLQSISSDNNVTQNDNSAISSISKAGNSGNFKTVLQGKAQNSENSKSSAMVGNNKEAVIKGQSTIVKNVSDKTNEGKLQDIEKEADDIKNGTKSVNDDDLASMIASLEQMVGSLLNNASTTQSAQSTSDNLDSNLISKLTDLKNNLAQYVGLLSSGENNSAQTLADSISKLGLGKTDSSKDISSTETDIPVSTIISTTANTDVTTQIITDTNDLLSTIKNEISNLMQDMKSSESNANLSVENSKLNYAETLLNVTSKVLSTTDSSKNDSSTNIDMPSNGTQVDFYTKNSSLSLGSGSSTSSSYSGSDTSSGSFSNNTSGKDIDFLNTLIDNKSSSDKYSKVTSVMNQLLNNNNISSSSEIKNETPVVRSSNFSEDLITSLKYMDSNNIKDLTVTIAPKGLGTVMINITTENGVMKASITATNKEAYNLLNANAEQINSSLSSQEIKVTNVNINIYNGDTTYFKDSSNSQNTAQQGERKSKTSNSINGIIDDATENVNGIYENDNVNALV